MFVEEGVYNMGTESQVLDAMKSIIWTLVDADESRNGVPIDLIYHATPFFIIYTTSPIQKRWSRLHKTVSEIVIIMNPWTRSEIHQV